MNPLKIALLNVSTIIPHDEYIKVASALQIQADRDFGPEWEKSADIGILGDPTSPIEPDACPLYIMDDADQADALGYHDITASGMPIGKVFAKTSKDDGVLWSVSASHELLELIGNPWVDSMVISPTDFRLYPREACDPVEADADGYDIDVNEGQPNTTPDNVRVSNFVCQGWFGVPKQKIDFLGQLTEPFTLRPGGYYSYLNLNDLNSGWQQVFGATAARSRMRPRMERRKKLLPFVA